MAYTFLNQIKVLNFGSVGDYLAAETSECCWVNTVDHISCF